MTLTKKDIENNKSKSSKTLNFLRNPHEIPTIENKKK